MISSSKSFSFIVAVLAFAVFQAHAESEGHLCDLVNNGINGLESIARQVANEQNPIKKDALSQKLTNYRNAINSGLVRFLASNEISKYLGTVSSMNMQRYTGANGFFLQLTLPCPVKINFRFLGIADPRQAQMLPSDTPLAPWLSLLSELAVNDTVTFSGKFSPPAYNYMPYFPSPTDINFGGNWKHPLELSAVVTGLCKGKCLPSVSTQHPQAEANRAASESQCRVILQHAEDTQTVPYNGVCKDGMANGRGLYSFSRTLKNGAILTAQVSGSFRDGKLNGQGTLFGHTELASNPSGAANSVASGEFLDNKLWNGLTKVKHADQLSMVIEWKHGAAVQICHAGVTNEPKCTERQRLLGKQ